MGNFEVFLINHTAGISTLTVRLYPAVRRPKGVLGYALEVAFVLLSPPLDREVHHRLVVALPLLGYVVLGAVEQHLVILVLQKI